MNRNNEQNKKLKKRLSLIIIILLFIAIMSLGATIAYLQMVAQEEEDSTKIYTGSLALKFSQGEIIQEQLFYPIENPTLENNDYTYINSFSVEQTGTVDSTLKIGLELIENQFTENAIKYAIYNSEKQLMIKGSIPKEGNVIIIENILFQPGDIAEYTLMLWLEETYTNQSEDQNKTLTANIIAEAEQVKG